jgi:hypothetical protein
VRLRTAAIHLLLFARLFRFRIRCFVSALTNASFDALNNMRTAASMRAASVSPGTFGGGNGFIWSHHTAACPVINSVFL